MYNVIVMSKYINSLIIILLSGFMQLVIYSYFVKKNEKVSYLEKHQLKKKKIKLFCIE